MRASSLRIAGAALLTTALLSIGAAASASSISSSDADRLNSATPSPVTANAVIEPSDNPLSQGALSDSQSALELVSDVALASTQFQISLNLEDSGVVASGPTAPKFLAKSAFPLALSDVPEPTAFGLFLLGLAGLFIARRVSKKS